MGVDLRELIPPEAKEEVELEALNGKIIALDAYNALYQFLAAIRQPDGTPLMDREKRVTSHLSGLFYRTINLAEAGIKPVYVFDGKPPELKKRELEARFTRRVEAERKYIEARKAGQVEDARKYAAQAVKLTQEMVADAKRLLDAMGIPWIQAPEEGEAQAAHLASRGDAWAAGSQDYDALLFGSPRLSRNLAITGKRKLPGKNIYVNVKPEIIDLSKLLKGLGLTREQLILIGILIGTDYNPGGVPGYGVKHALTFARSAKDVEKALEAIQARLPEYDAKRIFNYFLNPVVTDDYTIEFREPDRDEVMRILVEEHDFSEERVDKALERLEKAYKSVFKSRHVGLDSWFK